MAGAWPGGGSGLGETQSAEQSSSLAPVAAGERSLLGTQRAWDGLTRSGLCTQGSGGNELPQRDKAKGKALTTTGGPL